MCICPPRYSGSSIEKTKKMKFQQKSKKKKRKVKRTEENRSKEKKRKMAEKKRGPRGVPFVLQIQTFQKKERIKRVATNNEKKEKAGLKGMPTHNIANSCTPDNKKYIHAEVEHLKLQFGIIRLKMLLFTLIGVIIFNVNVYKLLKSCSHTYPGRTYVYFKNSTVKNRTI